MLINFLKKTLAFLICIALCAYSAWKQMQLLTVVSLLAILAIIFMEQTKRVLKIILDLLSSTKVAKLGKLEVQIAKELEDISERVAGQTAWVQILLSHLTKDEIGLLLAISKVKRFTITNALKDRLRSLRGQGLIQHDKSTMKASTKVWLTELGHDFVKIVLTADAVDA